MVVTVDEGLLPTSGGSRGQGILRVPWNPHLITTFCPL